MFRVMAIFVIPTVGKGVLKIGHSTAARRPFAGPMLGIMLVGTEKTSFQCPDILYF